MAGRPWYAQGADLVHRLAVLGIIGYSGYLCYNIGGAVKHNYDTKQRKLLLSKQAPSEESIDQQEPGKTA